MESPTEYLPEAKRQRTTERSSLTSEQRKMDGSAASSTLGSLSDLVREGKWEELQRRALECPDEVRRAPHPSPLALACRAGAPYECVKAILDADPLRLRHVLDSRGTPLHEAVVCELAGAEIIRALLQKDEELLNHEDTQISSATRATLLQDVDGFTPLHLLIRRRFQAHIQRSDDDNSLMKILELLVVSCPEAVVIPDRGEYEEPPIVYALKANIYAPSLGSEDDTIARIELQIYEMVACMLKHCPSAASRVFTGYRGQYTALHSAVFHGRCTRTIDLILETERLHPSDRKAALLVNTQGELPLHFCAMRGERPRSVSSIASAAPQAVFQRDASGLTPFHWLWIRYVSTLLALDDGGRGCNSVTPLAAPFQTDTSLSRYNSFVSLEQENFDADLHLIRRLDPPVDFLRMRHIPLEVMGDSECMKWAERSVEILTLIRSRYNQAIRNSGSSSETSRREIVWTRQEVVMSFFWTKVVSMLEAARKGSSDQSFGESPLVHTAFASECCLPWVAHIAASLFSDELSVADSRGLLPIHHAARRSWHPWDWPREDGLNEPIAAELLRLESFMSLRVALRLSPSSAIRVADRKNRIPLHYAIETFIVACTQPARATKESPMEAMMELLLDMVRLYPESLCRRDGVTKLYPFLQSAAVATANQTQRHAVHEELPLSITYALLRENPTIFKEYL